MTLTCTHSFWHVKVKNDQGNNNSEQKFITKEKGNHAVIEYRKPSLNGQVTR